MYFSSYVPLGMQLSLTCKVLKKYWCKSSAYYYSMSLTASAYLQQVGIQGTVNHCHATVLPLQDRLKRPEGRTACLPRFICKGRVVPEPV
jgi:hypothetical protein